LRGRSLEFIWAFAPSTRRAPSAASLLTAQLPSTHGVQATAASFLPTRVTSLPELLRRGGYATAAFLPDAVLNRSRGLDRGFDRYEAGAARGESGCGDAADRATRWIEDHSREATPWFVWWHCPLGVPTSATAPDRLDTQVAHLSEFDRALGALLSSASNTEREVGVTFTALVGTLPGAAPVAPPLSAEALRIPLFWSPPNARAHDPRSGPVGLVDIAPTLLGVAGLPEEWWPASVAGDPLPEPSEAAPPEAGHAGRVLFAEAPDSRAVIMGRHFYARGAADAEATTGRLGEDGTLGDPRRVPTDSEDVQLLEEILRTAFGRTDVPARPIDSSGTTASPRGGKDVAEVPRSKISDPTSPLTDRVPRPAPGAEPPAAAETAPRTGAH
jgi:hypothetical protein